MAHISRYYDVKRDPAGHRFLEVRVTGFPLLHLPLLNKSTAFTEEERRLLGLEGLLPPGVSSIEEQKERAYLRFRQQGTPLEKHAYLRNLQDYNEVLFFALLEDHVEEMLPIIYTPTVGDAVREFSRLYRYPRGFAMSTAHVERARELLDNVHQQDVRMIVATDSSAILGIGDQGFGGMAISIGKLSLYTVAGGVGPDKTLPVELDVGTGRQDLIEDPLYLGARHPRLTGEAYDAFIDAFVRAVQDRYPKAIIQWEDFSKDTAFRVLERYRKVVPSFNDDIQGTGAVTLAGVLRACALKGERLRDQVVVIHGAGAGGAGVAGAIREGMRHEGLSEDEIARRVFVLDSRGLLTDDRQMEEYKRPLATPKSLTDGWAGTDLLSVVREAGATVLLGLSGQGGIFNEPIVRAVHANTARPIVFPLSNPTANTEALPEDILRWTDGAAIVATGSPFPDVTVNGQTYAIGQGNNAFIFPGLGLAAVLTRASEITDGMVAEAAYALADFTAREYPERTYPPTRALRDASRAVALRVARQAIEEGVAREEKVAGLDEGGLAAFIESRFWVPKYLPYRTAEGASPALE
ncbi:NAD-dependent malic enzyme [Deinococcus metallilatus]|uniref:Malate dehydrogenase (Oxaloacetate-decarboxylating) n=1 Tax=Deinococcus metallilatus TaxID=1211322 RepID=A0AAJ5JXQ2_9DEIO|nr:NAD-dependent malic enzyme [Deinococcus metallilatus]MBB5296450.1 malate dehydrogenase (oxaloacetate-decarboxylating) [Deinococcus metallilatus]QBY09881.1 NAD-dependent malic enzyme [Deinococcus metallilatus]RXJ08605.1 NAD-dependent malic enzyme [Deinococcus metallilatus]TLK25079.1 NAD-dependent malic enzyme [Deinococcus metallilatus]GMA14637.1 NAD-dependent malic enzyme [Deinococcus metallilatus]